MDDQKWLKETYIKLAELNSLLAKGFEEGLEINISIHNYEHNYKLNIDKKLVVLTVKKQLVEEK